MRGSYYLCRASTSAFMIKLIVTDLDGSLVNDKKEIPEDFWALEKALYEKGVIFAIASGRPLHNIAMEFAAIKEHTYFISDNGSYIVHRDEELLVIPLGKEILKEFITVSRTLQNVFPVLCGKQMAFLENHNEALMKMALQYYKEYEIVKNLEEVTEPILKISLCDLEDPYSNSYPAFKPFENKYKVAVSGTHWLDITCFDADKGNAVKFLQQRLNIRYDETMVFGDYLNDLEMMKSGKYSYAMKNAQPPLFEAANFITEFDNNHGGVVHTIKKCCFT